MKYEVPVNAHLLHCSRTVLLANVGVKELTGNNDGPKIRLFLKSVGINHDASYCAAYQYYCFDAITEDKSMIPIKRTGVANQIYSDAKKRGKSVYYSPAVDDLITWKYGGSWRGHIERVIEVHPAGWVITVGANTSNGKTGSQREGNGVFKRRRNVLHPLGRMNIRGLIGFNTEEKK